MHRTTSIALLALAVALTAVPAPVGAKLSADLKCRIALGPATQKATKVGLAQTDKCLKKSPSAACNVVDQGAIAARLKPLAKKCAQAECTKALYGGDVAAAIAAGVKTALETSGSAVFPAPATGGDKAKTKCLKAIVAGRSALVKNAFGQAVRKERLRAAECQSLDNASVAPNDALGSSLRSKLSKACGTLQGGDLGACADLPNCVVDGANDAVRRLGRAAYTAPPECGDGATQGTEQCDDGNRVDGDTCTNSCQNAQCGDGVVRDGVEGCDDRNNVETDDCLKTCVVASCGDGFVHEGVEQCDDGNTNDGDACRNDCQLNRVACGPGGLDVTIDLTLDRTDVVGVRLDVHFDHDRVSIPGVGPDGLDRTTQLVPDPATDDLLIVNDELFNFDTNTSEDPDRVRVVFVKDSGAESPAGLSTGPFVRFRYDCSGTPDFLPADFGCTVIDASDTLGRPVTAACVTSSVAPAP